MQINRNNSHYHITIQDNTGTILNEVYKGVTMARLALKTTVGMYKDAGYHFIPGVSSYTAKEDYLLVEMYECGLEYNECKEKEFAA